MKNVSRLAIAALSGAVVLALAGCGADGASSDSTDGSESPAATGTLAYSPTSLQLPILAEQGKLLEELAADAGWSFTMIDGEFDPAVQNQQVMQALDNGSIQALYLAPVAGPAAMPLVAHAQQLGIPVIVQTTPADIGFDGAQPGIAFQAPNFAAFGETVGDEVASCVADNKLGTAEALMITAPDTLPGTGEIKDAALDAMGDSVDIVAEAQVADIATAQTQTEQLLGAHPDAKVVIAFTEEGAFGAANAYKVAGKTPACIILGGGGPDAVAAQEAGDFTTLVAWDFMGSVPQGWAALQELIADPTAKGAVIDIPFTIKK